MKSILSKSAAVALLALTLAINTPVFAQTAVVSTTTTSGTISEFSPDTIVVRSTTSAEPMRYRYSKTTTYVDETGAPVSMEIVKSGLPVTVHYVKEGNDLVASKVIVRRTTTTAPAPAAIEEKKTTTTTTTTKEKD